MGQKPRRVRGAHVAKNTSRPASAKGAQSGRNPLWQQNRQILCQNPYFSFSSLFSSDMKVLISLNWRYTLAKRT